MKNLKITLLTLLISVASFAQQGIVFQGIARDNNSAAITDQTMTFTFRITKSDGGNLYQETQQIKTDNFGVFSHIIGTGNAVTGTFAEVDYQLPNLKSVISVNYKGVDTEIYDQPFQYVPYAKAAGNGVPVGTIVPFIGVTAPKGWVLCNGTDITDAKYTTLRQILGENKTPNLQGRFLKGAGAVDTNLQQEVALKEFQDHQILNHRHRFSYTGYTNTDGRHRHKFDDSYFAEDRKFGNGFYGSKGGYDKDNDTFDIYDKDTKWGGEHKHKFTINHDTQNVKGPNSNFIGKENRPFNYGVNYIIKY